MGYVAAAYGVVVALVSMYWWTLLSRIEQTRRDARVLEGKTEGAGARVFAEAPWREGSG